LHTLQAVKPLAFASFSEIGILLLERYRQEPRWYFCPVLVM
jgi:hypothetical protein